MKKLYQLFVLVLALFLIMSTPISAATDQAIGWYCVRNSEHKQPLLDRNLQFIDQYHCYYVDKTHGDLCEEKVVYLTFDAGYENGNIEKILNILKEEQVIGAFFVLENLFDKNPDLILRMEAEGHTVCNHTAKHRDMTKIESVEEFQTELEVLETRYRQLTGKEMKKYYRPPEGKINERSLRFADELGYHTVLWSFAYADWDNQKQPAAESAKQKIMENLHNGAVILLHPTSATNAQILGDVIRQIKDIGYRFASLDELVDV